MTIEEFAQLALAQTRERLARLYSQSQADAEQVEVIPGPKYTKVDRGTPFGDSTHPGQGYLMVENATGNIYGIKGYGRAHRGHFYGTLDTVDQWYWGDFYPSKRDKRFMLYTASEAKVQLTAVSAGDAISMHEKHGSRVVSMSLWSQARQQWEAADRLLKLYRAGKDV